MSIDKPKECPNCKSNQIGNMSPPTGTSFVLTTVDQEQNPPSFNPTSGLPVNVIGCAECGVATLHVPSIR